MGTGEAAGTGQVRCGSQEQPGRACKHERNSMICERAAFKLPRTGCHYFRGNSRTVDAKMAWAVDGERGEGPRTLLMLSVACGPRRGLPSCASSMSVLTCVKRCVQGRVGDAAGNQDSTEGVCSDCALTA